MQRECKAYIRDILEAIRKIEKYTERNYSATKAQRHKGNIRVLGLY
jgi:uncharacterized protein with HEPN domain